VSDVERDLARYGFEPQSLTLNSIISYFGFSADNFSGTQMQLGDLVHVAMVGVISGATAYALSDVLTKFHDGPSIDDGDSAKRIFSNIKKMLGHSNNPIDQPGFEAARSVGKNPIQWHRSMYGHDPLNMEGWSRYIDTEGGPISGSFAYVKHLVADCFSRQGLPTPGHSYFREQIIEKLTSEQFSSHFTKGLIVEATN